MHAAGPVATGRSDIDPREYMAIATPLRLSYGQFCQYEGVIRPRKRPQVLGISRGITVNKLFIRDRTKSVWWF